MRLKHKAMITAPIVMLVMLLITVHQTSADAGPSVCKTANTDKALSASSEHCTAAPMVYGVEMRALMAEMIAHPRPELEQIPVDEHMLYQRAYRKVLKETDIYSETGGRNIAGHIDPGLNFVNADSEQNG